MRTVHLRINDAATGRPTPVRLRIAAPDGSAFAPLGRPAEFATGRGEDVGGHLLLGRDQRWWHIDGSCEIPLPDGVPLTVEARKGPEFAPLVETVTLTPGQLTLRLSVRRVAGPAADGWYAGDVRAHVLPPHAALLEGAAEGLAVVHLLALQTELPSVRDGRTYLAVPNLLAFSGQTAALASEEWHCRVSVNTFNVHPVLGRLGLLHTHRPVFPLVSGGDAGDDWAVSDWCHQAHRKAGLVVWAGPNPPEIGHDGEALAAVVLGLIDAIEVSPPERGAVQLWARLLNAGLRVPLAGASGKGGNRVPLGAVRTYARLPAGELLTDRGWIEAVRAGRTVVTNGPLLTFTVDDVDPGATLDRPTGAVLRLTAEARLPEGAGRLELVANGHVVADRAAEAGTPVVLEHEHAAGDGGWLAARVRGNAALPPAGTVPFAHSSAVFVTVDGKSPPADPSAVAALVQSLERCRDWAVSAGRFPQEAARGALLHTLDAAREKLLAAAGG
jgi:hypothetical protein